MQRLTTAQARRIALAAQGFADPRPIGRVDIRHLRRVMDRVAVLQIDSVNVLARSHYLPVFSRLGPYPRRLLDDAAYRRREMFEYFFHQASLSRPDVLPLMRQRMESMRPWGRVRAVMEQHPGYIESVHREVEERGPLSSSELGDPGKRTGPWWGMGKGPTALEWLYASGRLAISQRPSSFTKVYDLAQRVYPVAFWAEGAIGPDETVRRKLLIASRAHGIGTARDLADYFRIRIGTARPRLAELVEEGSLLAVEVDGWRQPAYLHREARLPRRVDARALLSPFDSLIWERDRTERLFGFRYRIEIYVPEPDRRYGYYVLPFLLGDELVARVDLKADRGADALRVRGAFGEPAAPSDSVAEQLALTLHDMAGWLDLGRVTVSSRGDLSGALADAVASTAP